MPTLSDFLQSFFFSSLSPAAPSTRHYKASNYIKQLQHAAYVSNYLSKAAKRELWVRERFPENASIKKTTIKLAGVAQRLQRASILKRSLTLNILETFAGKFRLVRAASWRTLEPAVNAFCFGSRRAGRCSRTYERLTRDILRLALLFVRFFCVFNPGSPLTALVSRLSLKNQVW